MTLEREGTAPKSWTLAKLQEIRRQEGWQHVGDYPSAAAARAHLESAGWAVAPETAARLRNVWPQVTAYESGVARGAAPATDIVGLDRAGTNGYVSLVNRAAHSVHVWAFPAAPVAPVPSDGPLAAFRRLAVLAQGGRTDCTLRFLPQEDRAFMWRAPLVHPLQVRENAYQSIVVAAGRDPDCPDPITARSEALARFFQQAGSVPEPMAWKPPRAEEPHWASVRMNHLIETFYLFRLLVHYEVSAPGPVEDALRIELSGALTKLLQNGDRALMGWLSDWLTAKVADLGRRMERLNRGTPRRVIFFLKGGRALNYFLGTPQNGENDWDTQVVIDPRLPAAEWYALFSRVHDELLDALQAYNAEFASLVTAHAAEFADYLAGIDGPAVADDDEPDDNEVRAVETAVEHASCKAELIDIGLPRRDSASALEEWERLSPDGALLDTGGVIYPFRPYYINEYLMMVRSAFVAGAEVHKAAKRVVRFAMLLAGGPRAGEPAGADGPSRRLAVLPKTVAAIAAVTSPAVRELYRVIATQFAEAYGLPQDAELAGYVDDLAAASIAAPPALPAGLAQTLAGLTDGQRAVAVGVGVAHALSQTLLAHARERSTFVVGHRDVFDGVIRRMAESIREPLAARHAQLAVTGGYAAYLHALAHGAAGAGRDGAGFEPVRRIVVHLQCPPDQPEDAVMAAVRDALLGAATADGRLEEIALDETSDPKRRSLSLRWKDAVAFGTAPAYRPQVLKIRAAVQHEHTLPVLAAIDGLPVLGLRHLVADYLRKTAKTDETGMRATFSEASGALLAMMSQFDATSAAAQDRADLE